MKIKHVQKVGLLGLTFALGTMGFVGQASAGAVIFNTGDETTATVALGVNDLGELNTADGSVVTNSSRTGLAARIDGNWVDATSPGCYCEGWGVSVNGTTSGYANVSVGTSGLTADSFGSTASTATVITSLTALPGLTVTHEYRPSASGDLFEAVVTIANNTGAGVTDVTYRRVMDWDVPPTEFSEYVTIGGTATTTLLKASGNNGFMTADPLYTIGYTIGGTSCTSGTPGAGDFVDCGPEDHGAVFDFDFGALADGEEATFSIFYGASLSEALAEAALGVVGAELYSFGQSSGSGSELTGEPLTYIFAFSGVGGVIVFPPDDPKDVPEANTLAMLGLGLGLISLVSARRRKSI